MKLFLAVLHEITESVEGFSTISKVLLRNGGGPTSYRPSTGCGGDDEEDDDAPPQVVLSSFTCCFTPSMR